MYNTGGLIFRRTEYACLTIGVVSFGLLNGIVELQAAEFGGTAVYIGRGRGSSGTDTLLFTADRRILQIGNHSTIRLNDLILLRRIWTDPLLASFVTLSGPNGRVIDREAYLSE